MEIFVPCFFLFFFGNELINNNVYVVTKQQRNYTKILVSNFVKLHCNKIVDLKQKKIIKLAKMSISRSRLTVITTVSAKIANKTVLYFFVVFKIRNSNEKKTY